MPKINFRIQWPDGTEETCYLPSLVVKRYFTSDSDYPLPDFVERARTALTIASDRVQAKYGFPCSLALRQLQRIEARAAQSANQNPYASQDATQTTEPPTVRFLQFLE